MNAYRPKSGSGDFLRSNTEAVREYLRYSQRNAESAARSEAAKREKPPRQPEQRRNAPDKPVVS